MVISSELPKGAQLNEQAINNKRETHRASQGSGEDPDHWQHQAKRELTGEPDMDPETQKQ